VSDYLQSDYQRFDYLREVNETRPTYVAVGVFDGVHQGHRQLLRGMTAAAKADGAATAVLTFFPHPRAVIQNLSGRLYLGTLAERVELLAAEGIDIIITHPFNEEVRQTRAAEFVRQLRDHLNLRQLWGGSFSLGYEREGDAEFLRKMGVEQGFTVHEVSQLVLWRDKRVSSSRIRRGLDDGNMDEVTGCLGRPYQVSGVVVVGDKRGRTIGFPTANLYPWEQQLLPANGVYASYAWINGRRFTAATNVGVRPTVDGHKLTVEAHLLDFNEDIYGQPLKLDFVHRLRDERKFAGLDELVNQIQADVNQVRGWAAGGEI
jgi:riboflavin kinase / FMN adenylyltransferase